MYGSALSLRDYGPRGVFDALDDTALEFHLEAASRMFDSYAGNRGYSMALGTFTPDLEMSVYKVAVWSLMTATVGVNPADPGHMALKMAHDEAVAWWRDIGKGIANPGGAPTGRLATATIGVFSTLAANGTAEPSRGW